jgi:hypothetical protein
MRVLGFDPSLTNFGWALHDTEAPRGPSRCLGRGRFKTSSKTLFVARYMDLRDRVGELLQMHQPDAVASESSVFGEMYSEGMYGLFLYVCEACYVAKTDLVLFTPPQLKAHARLSLDRPTVNGRLWKMHKGDMSEAAREHCGGKGRIWDNNEADAYWASVAGGRFWSRFHGVIGDDALTPVERKQFARIHTYQRGKKAGETVKTGLLYRENERFWQWSKETD